MRNVHLDKVAPGCMLARTVLDSEGRVLLSKGTIIKDNYIKRLKELGIIELYIEDRISEGIEIKDVVAEETRNEARRVLQTFAPNRGIKATFNTDKVENVIDKIIYELIDNTDILVNLSDIKSFDGYTFEHSVNVSILSMITAIGLGYNKNKIREIGIGAILHDIGKLRVPINILNKPSKLTEDEFEEIKKHTIYGYDSIKQLENISSVSSYIVLAHHERYNGTGYPLKLKGDKIHESARIVAVADVYDALTSDRVYRKKLMPYQALEYITTFSLHYFDEKVVKSFVSNIAIYPVGTGVQLNTGEKCLIVKAFKNAPTRPVVRVIYDKNSNKLNDFYEIDLNKKLNLFISDSCEL